MAMSWDIFSVDGQGCVLSPLFDLRPNYGGGNEDNGDLLQKVPCMHCHTQCPRPCNKPLTTHISAGDFWTLRPHRQVWISLLRGHCSFLLGSGVHKVLFEPSGHLWWVWDLILNMISPLLPWKSWRTWNNRMVPNQERSTSRLYIATLLI